MDVAKIYDEHVRSLSVADQLRLVAHIAAKVAGSAETSPIPPAVVLPPPDPADPVRWAEWLDASMRAAGERRIPCRRGSPRSLRPTSRRELGCLSAVARGLYLPGEVRGASGQ